MILACLDGGLICGPLLVALVSLILGWLGFRKRCEDHECEHKCIDESVDGSRSYREVNRA